MNATRVARHAGMELRMLLRNGEQLLLAFAIPLGLVIGGLLWGRQFGLDGSTFPASVIAVAVWSTAFTSLGVATGFERRYGVLERLVATPLTRADLIAGKALASKQDVSLCRQCCQLPPEHILFLYQRREGFGVALGKRLLFFLEHNDKQRNRFGLAVQDLQQPRCVGGARGHRIRLADCYPSVPWQKRSVGQRWRWR